MMNLFDIMQSAQHGQALPNLAQQYGLTMQQTQAALDALLPALHADPEARKVRWSLDVDPAELY